MNSKKLNMCMLDLNPFDPNMPARPTVTEIYGEYLPYFGHKITWILHSNRNLLRGLWVEKRGFKKDFLFNYTPDEFDGYLAEVGFRIVYRKGVGLVITNANQSIQWIQGEINPYLVCKDDQQVRPLCNGKFIYAD